MPNLLIDAIINNNIDKVENLIEKGFNINELQTDSFISLDGRLQERNVLWAPVDLALSLKRDEIATILLQKGAKTNTTIRKKSEKEEE